MALSGYIGHMANVSLTLLAAKQPKSSTANNNKAKRICLFCTCRVNELQDPTYQYKVDIKNFEVRLSPLMDFKQPSVYVSCLKSTVIFPGNEGLLPDYSRPLRPLPDLPGRQSLFRTQEHAVLRYHSTPHLYLLQFLLL